MQTREFAVQARIEAEVVEGWVDAGWLAPREGGGGRDFSEVDLARAHLIRDLQHLGVNDEGIPVILDLLDQLHGLRGLVRDLLSTIQTQFQEQGRA